MESLSLALDRTVVNERMLEQNLPLDSVEKLRKFPYVFHVFT